MENIEKELNEEEVYESEVVEDPEECTDMCEYDDEPEEDSSLGAVLAGAAVAGTALVGGLVLKKYGPRIKAWAKDKHQKHLAKKDQKAMEYLAKRGVTGEDLDMATATKIVEETPVEEIPVEKVETKEEKKEEPKKSKK